MQKGPKTSEVRRRVLACRQTQDSADVAGNPNRRQVHRVATNTVKSLARGHGPLPGGGSAAWSIVGSRLQGCRIELGLSAEQVAVVLGIPSGVYAGYEQGVSPMPALELAQIANLFRVPVRWFVRDLAVHDEKASKHRACSDASDAFNVAAVEQSVRELSEGFLELDRDDLQRFFVKAAALRHAYVKKARE